MNSSLDDTLMVLAELDEHQLDEWIAHHSNQITLPLLQQLKTVYADGDALISRPALADKMTRHALLLAQCVESRHVKALAAWARGNWASLHDPNLAVQLYQIALPALSDSNDRLGIARIHGSLSYLYTIKGRFEEAEAERLLALPEFQRQFPEQPLFLLRLMRNHGLLLHCKGQFDAALQEHDKVIALARQNGFPSIVISAQNNRALTLGMLGRLAEVEQAYLEDRDDAVRQGLLVEVARLDMNLGDFYTACGKPAQAYRRLHMSEAEFKQLNNSLEASTCRWLLGVLLHKIGVHDAALHYLEDALATFTSRGMLTEVTKVQFRIAELQRLRGEFNKAARMLHSAERTALELGDASVNQSILIERAHLDLSQGQPERALQSLGSLPADITPYNQAHAHLLLAETHGMLNNPQSAEQFYEKVLKFAQDQDETWLLQQSWKGLGRILANEQPQQSLIYLRKAVAVAEDMRSTLSIEELKSALHAQSKEIYEDLIQTALAQGETMEALSCTWRAKSSAFVELLMQRYKENTRALDDVDVEIAHLRQQLATLHWSLQQDGAGDDFLATQARAESRRLERALLDLKRLRQLPHAGNSPSQIEAFANPFQSPERALAAMDAGLLIEYARCHDHIVGFWANRAGHCGAMHLISISELNRLLARLRLKFSHVLTLSPSQRAAQMMPLLHECLPILHQLGERLIEPLLKLMGGQSEAKKLAIAPCAPLFEVPFAALRLGPFFLSNQFEITMIQSGALFGLPAIIEPKASGPPVVIAASADKVVQVREEATEVASLLSGCRVYIDEPALSVLANMRPAPSVIHLAAHTLQKEDLPLFSGLQLFGEVLTVERCYDLNLSETALVTLSGCTTASGLNSGGQLLSLLQALFVAGAKSVLSSLHAVPDDVAVVWMSAFYHHYVRSQNVAESVRIAQQTLQQQSGMNHPALWAAFAAWWRQ